MKILSVDHLGVATRDINESLKFYTDILGLKLIGTEDVAEQKVRTAFLPIGETEIEILESTDPDGPIAKYIDKNGEGIQHMALRVDDIEVALAELKSKGVRLIDEAPRRGADGTKIAFIHPKATRGILLELCQRD